MATKRQLLSLLTISAFIIALLLPDLTFSQSIVACSSNPVCAAELGLISNAARVAAAPLVPVSTAYITSAGAAVAGVAAVYTSAQIVSIQNAALQWHLSNTSQLYVARVDGQPFDNTPRTLAQCQSSSAFIYYPTRASCVTTSPTSWGALTQIDRDNALASSPLISSTSSLVVTQAQQNQSVLESRAISLYDEAGSLFRVPNISSGDIKITQADSIRIESQRAADVTGSLLSPTVESSRQISLQDRQTAIIPTPNTSPPPGGITSTPPPSTNSDIGVFENPVTDTIQPTRFSGQNFLSYAVSKFSNKFPFDIFGTPSSASLQSLECPSYRFFTKTFELCPIRDIYTVMQVPIIISFLVWSVMSL